jgi:filamentous hemagglutinin family protein
MQMPATTREGVRLLGMVRRNRLALMMSTALQASTMLVLAVPAHAQPAPNARPNGGTVIAGNAAVSQSATNTRIDQTSQRAAINWQSFDVGSQQSVTFNQPSVNAVALNRVTGPDPSQIAGRIDANGQVILVNQSGVNFYKGAQVNAAGLVVSTANTTDKAFMAGGAVTFDQPGKPDAKIANQGNITIRQAGLAALVAPQVANSGTISAKLGHVVLAGAKTATLDLYGDGLLTLDVSDGVTQAPVGKNGNTVTALVTNSGTIVADGGTVQLTARAADGIVQNLVQAGGKIRAATVGDRTGTIALNGVGGSIVVEGQLSAPGRAGTTGGNIEVVSTGNVGVASSARINASGQKGGGTIAIGTTLARAKGGPAVTPAVTAKNVTVQQGAAIAANGASNGTGGKITVLSSGTTRMAGTINAKGGKTAGDGGFVEVSGGDLALTGAVDLSAPNGTTGTLLLDPDQLTIAHDNSPGGSLDPTLHSNNQITYGDAPGAAGIVTDFEINSLNANILLQAVQTITLNAGAPLSLHNNRSLTLQTQTGDITIGSSITASGTGAIIMQAGTNVGSGGRLIINASLTADATTGSIALQADGGISFGAALSAATVDLSNIHAGGVTEGFSGVIDAGTLLSSGGVAGNASIGGVNDVGTLAAFAVTGNLGLSDVASTGGLAITGPVSAGFIGINGPRSLTIAGSVTAIGTMTLEGNGPNAGIILNSGAVVTGSTIRLYAGVGGIQLNGNSSLGNAGAMVDLQTTGNGVAEAKTATLIAGTLQSSSGITGSAALAGTANAVTSIGTLAVSGGTFSLTDTGDLHVAGKLSADGVTISDTGALSVAGTALASNAMSLTAGNILIPGNVTGAAVTLSATTGGISEMGVLNAGTLTGGAATTATLTGAGNAIGTLNGFTAAGFTLNDGIGLTVLGTVSGGPAATITDRGALAINGAVAAASVSLSGDSITIPGNITGGTVSLAATGGAIDETGVLNAGTLSGNAATTASLTGTSFSNQIGTLNEFSAVGFTLENGIDLNASGTVSGGPNAMITDKGALTIGGALTASTVNLTANSVTIPGNVAGTAVSLSATTGGIRETGVLSAGTLTGSAAGGADLTGSNQVGTLNGFTAAGFTLVDRIDLTVFGTVTGGPNATIASKGALAINGTVTATSVSLTGSSVAIPGNVSGTTVALSATNGAIDEAGTLTAGTLTGSAATTANLTGTSFRNSIGTLGDFSAAGLTLSDGIGLTVAGTVSGGPSATIVDKGPLAISGAVNAGTVSLTADSMTIPGKVTGTDVALFGTVGTISETGVLNAGTLTGSAATTANLTGTANQIGTLGNFTASGFSLVDGILLTVAGLVAGGPSATIVDTGLLSINGTVNAGAVSLTADSITIPGNVMGTSVALSATGGGIDESGVLNAGTLTGSAATAANLTGTAFSNQIGTLGNFAATGFTLTDGIPLTVGGTVSGGSGATIVDKGALAIDGTVNAAAVGLAADSITIPGNVVGTSVVLSAISGGIDETGVIDAGTLTGSAATTANLTGTANQIATLGNFTASGFSLVDGVPLNVAGLVAGGPSATIVDTGRLAINGTVTAGAVSLSADSVTIPGNVTGISVALSATSGGIDETGVINAGTLTGSAATAANLTGTANQTAELGNFTASGFSLVDGIPLSVAGIVAGGPSATIVDTGLLAIHGTVTAGAVSLTADSITIPGNVTGTSVTLSATHGGIAETGAIDAGTLTGSAVMAASLTGTSFSNQIGTLGNFAASGFTLNDGIPLTVAGTVSGGPGATIVDKGPLAIDGAVNATVVRLTADSITIPGNVTGTSVALSATSGGIDETGVIDAGTLTGSAATTASLTGAGNQIGTLGNFTASGFSMVDGADLTVSGNVNGGPSVTLLGGGTITIAANSTVSGNAVSTTGTGNIDILGTVQAAGSISLVSRTGSIFEPGALITGLLTGSAAGNAQLTGTSSSNRVGQIGSFISGRTLTLDDGTALTIAGPLTAPTIVIDTGPTTLTLADGAVITTGGTRRPKGLVASFPGDTAANTSNGAFLTTSGGFNQLGTSTIEGIGGAPSVLRINALGSANIAFSTVGGLQATGTWLILDIGGGDATGQINVRDLDVLQSGIGGRASLTGTVTGLSGVAAAGAAGIEPGVNLDFRLNSCPIHAATCALLVLPDVNVAAELAVPVSNPLNDIYFGSTFSPNEDDDLLLPIVSDQDY